MLGFLMCLINPIKDVLKEYLVNRIRDTIQVGEHVDKLMSRAGILRGKMEDINQRIQNDEIAMKVPRSEVKEWLKRVEKVLNEADSIHSQYEDRNCILFPGTTCSFNCPANYSICMDAIRTLPKVEDELKSIREFEGPLTTEAPLPPVKHMSTSTIKFGREVLDSKLEEAMMYLKDEQAEDPLGIWGMGGVGKTTLLEHINNTLEKDPMSFDKVIFVTASRECTVEKLQEKIVKELCPKELCPQDLLSEQPEQSKKIVKDYHTHIFSYLSKKSFLLLLDDLWDSLDLKEVGIPFPLGGAVDGKYKRKLILTTRDRQVCNDMKVKGRWRINVEALTSEAARSLFRDNVGEETINSDPVIAKLADEVADECRGLPIVLNALGKATCGQQTVEMWESTIRSLRESKHRKLSGMYDTLATLKLSYDYLKDTRERDCFLHCALWPEDYEIPKEELIECWMGHGLLGEFDDITGAYSEGYNIIDRLQKACLLEPVETNSFQLKGKYVKLHDVIRDMALWIARDCGEKEKKWVVPYDGVVPQDEKTWKEAHNISLTDTDFGALPSNIQNCPNLTTFILTGKCRMTSSFQYFRELKYLDLSGSISSRFFPIEICGLVKLEFLNLSYTSIESIPEEIKNLTELKYLLLRHTYISAESSGSWLANLVSLEVLDISNGRLSVIRPETQQNSSVFDNLDCFNGRLKGLGIDVWSLSDLQKLTQFPGIPVMTLSINEMDDLPLNLLRSQNIQLNLKELRICCCGESLEVLLIEEKLHLEVTDLKLLWVDLKDIVWKGVEPKDVLPKLRQLEIFGCTKLKHVTWAVKLPRLEELTLWACQNMEQVIEGNCSVPSFDRLRILSLRGLEKLSSVSHRALTFPSLEYLWVSDCPELKKLPFHSPTSHSNLRVIIGEEEWWQRLEIEDAMRTSLQPFFEQW